MARGILSQNTSAGLLSMLPANVGATPEALRRRREEEAARLAAEQRARTPEREQRRGPGLLDMIWGVAAGYSPNAVREIHETRQRQQAAAERQLEAQARLAETLGAGALSQGSSPGSGPASAAPATRAGLPSLRDVAPALIEAQLAGVEGVGSIRETLEAIQPNIDFVNGIGVDTRDPANVGQRVGVNLSNVNGVLADLNDPANANRFIPDVPEGAMPLYDSQGNVVAIRNIDGTVQATAERERAVNDARNASQASYAGAIAGSTAAGQAPYQIETVQGPDGRPIVTSRANILAQGGIAGQSPSEQAAAVDLAKGEAARENEQAATRQMDESQAPVLEEALRLLPDVITGFGANARLLADRARAGFDEDARKRVEATETFRAVMGPRVLAIARQLGSGSGVTDSDRAFAQEIAGGNIELSEGTIRRLLEIERQAAARRRSGGQVSREAALAELRRRGLVR